MAQKIAIIADPGIDTSFAIALALLDPTFDVVALIASAGNVGPEQATRNAHILINQIDPPKWPRLGAAIPVEYETDGRALHGPEGMGAFKVPELSLHSPLAGDKLLIEVLRDHPKEITVVVLGPSTILARAMERDPEVVNLVDRVIMMGGAWKVPGNATAAAEFHFFLDPVSARTVIDSGATVILLPLDVTRKLIFSPTDLLDLPCKDSPTCQLLRQMVPFGIRASSNLYGIEGFHLKDVLAIATIAVPQRVQLNGFHVAVETTGDLTRGMLIVDCRPNPAGAPNVLLGIDVDVVGVRDYIQATLGKSGGRQ